mgnify:CR=1 FL=1
MTATDKLIARLGPKVCRMPAGEKRAAAGLPQSEKTYCWCRRRESNPRPTDYKADAVCVFFSNLGALVFCIAVATTQQRRGARAQFSARLTPRSQPSAA